MNQVHILLQDPDDIDNENSPREIVVVCEHSICDGLSLSTLAHELLIALGDDDKSVFENRLPWPLTMEAAIKRSGSMWSRLVAFSKLMIAILRWRTTKSKPITRINLAHVDFPLNDMYKYCHTEVYCGMMSKQETQKLLEKCHRSAVTVTSAVTSAILCAVSTLEELADDRNTEIVFAIAADTRRRCAPPVPNHDLSYQVSGIMGFTIPMSDIPKTAEDMWQVANNVGHHVKASIDAGQVLALGMMMGKIYQKNRGPVNLAETPTCGISNWGTLPFRERYGRWELESMTPMGNMIRAPMPFVLMHTVNGVLTIGWVGSVPVIPLNTLETLCNSTMCKLRQMIED